MANTDNTANQIDITKCDNQLLLFAINSQDNNATYEICNIQSGNNNSVNVQIQLAAGAFSGTYRVNGLNTQLSESVTVKLPPGQYSLIYAGLNWGGPYNFQFSFNQVNYELLNNPNHNLEGVVWALGNKSIVFNV